MNPHSEPVKITDPSCEEQDKTIKLRQISGDMNIDSMFFWTPEDLIYRKSNGKIV